MCVCRFTTLWLKDTEHWNIVLYRANSVHFTMPHVLFIFLFILQWNDFASWNVNIYTSYLLINGETSDFAPFCDQQWPLRWRDHLLSCLLNMPGLKGSVCVPEKKYKVTNQPLSVSVCVSDCLSVSLCLSLCLCLSLSLSLSLGFNGHFPGEPRLAGVGAEKNLRSHLWALGAEGPLHCSVCKGGSSAAVANWYYFY